MYKFPSFKISFQHESHSVFPTSSLVLSKGVLLDTEYLIGGSEEEQLSKVF